MELGAFSSYRQVKEVRMKGWVGGEGGVEGIVNTERLF